MRQSQQWALYAGNQWVKGATTQCAPASRMPIPCLMLRCHRVVPPCPLLRAVFTEALNTHHRIKDNVFWTASVG